MQRRVRLFAGLIIQPHGFPDLFQEVFDIIQAVHYLAADDFLINFFIIVGQKISEAGDTGKTIGKIRIKHLILAKNIEGLCI